MRHNVRCVRLSRVEGFLLDITVDGLRSTDHAVVNGLRFDEQLHIRIRENLARRLGCSGVEGDASAMDQGCMPTVQWFVEHGTIPGES